MSETSSVEPIGTTGTTLSAATCPQDGDVFAILPALLFWDHARLSAHYPVNARLPSERLTYEFTVGLWSQADLRRDFERFVVEHALCRLGGSLLGTPKALQTTRTGLRFLMERL